MASLTFQLLSPRRSIAQQLIRTNPGVFHSEHAQWQCHGVSAGLSGFCFFFWLWSCTPRARLLISLVSALFSTITYCFCEMLTGYFSGVKVVQRKIFNIHGYIFTSCFPSSLCSSCWQTRIRVKRLLNWSWSSQNGTQQHINYSGAVFRSWIFFAVQAVSLITLW